MSAKYILKILTLGDQNVGKTNIILRYTENQFHEKINSTICIDFKTKLIKKGNEIIKLTLYDTAGQERFNNLIKNYYKGTNGVLLVYDITNRDTFKKIDFWLKDLFDNADDKDNLFIYLIGNKNDLADKRQVSEEEAKGYADENNLPYIEVSAKTGNNIKKLFDEMIKGSMFNVIKNGKLSSSVNQTIRLSFLDKEEAPVKNERCC